MSAGEIEPQLSIESLTRENDELRRKLELAIESNARLMESYAKAISDWLQQLRKIYVLAERLKGAGLPWQ